MKFNCIIVDDEEGARLILQEYIGRLDNLELKGSFSNAVDTYNFLKQNKTDVMFLDINMPQVDGFGLLDMIENKPAIVFTTAYSDYALKAFDSGAIDYLYKPIRFERFVKAIEKLEKFTAGLRVLPVAESIELKVGGETRILNTVDIHYIQSLGNYLKVHCKNSTYTVLMTMNEMEMKLDRSVFVRIQKSFIINLHSINSRGSDEVLVNGTSIPIGKTYKKYYLESLKAIHKK